MSANAGGGRRGECRGECRGACRGACRGGRRRHARRAVGRAPSREASPSSQGRARTRCRPPCHTSRRAPCGLAPNAECGTVGQRVPPISRRPIVDLLPGEIGGGIRHRAVALLDTAVLAVGGTVPVANPQRVVSRNGTAVTATVVAATAVAASQLSGPETTRDHIRLLTRPVTWPVPGTVRAAAAGGDSRGHRGARCAGPPVPGRRAAGHRGVPGAAGVRTQPHTMTEPAMDHSPATRRAAVPWRAASGDAAPATRQRRTA